MFPHLSVSGNVEYGLRAKGISRCEAVRRAGEALEQVALGGYGARTPAQLSGGQPQRVALARAIVNRPSVLLLDEPLGALDMQLRDQMQIELKKLHRQLGITFFYVTHSQSETMSVSDRVAVFSHGRIEQVDSPRKLYQTPATTFVAEFVGRSNVLRDDLARLAGASGANAIAIRPEHMRVRSVDSQPVNPCGFLRGVIADIQYLGANLRYEVEVLGQIVAAELPVQEEPVGLHIGDSACPARETGKDRT